MLEVQRKTLWTPLSVHLAHLSFALSHLSMYLKQVSSVSLPLAPWLYASFKDTKLQEGIKTSPAPFYFFFLQSFLLNALTPSQTVFANPFSDTQKTKALIRLLKKRCLLHINKGKCVELDLRSFHLLHALILWKIILGAWQEVSTHKGFLLPSLLSWVQFLRLTWWKERADSLRVTSDHQEKNAPKEKNVNTMKNI